MLQCAAAGGPRLRRRRKKGRQARHKHRAVMQCSVPAWSTPFFEATLATPLWCSLLLQIVSPSARVCRKTRANACALRRPQPPLARTKKPAKNARKAQTKEQRKMTKKLTHTFALALERFAGFDAEDRRQTQLRGAYSSGIIAPFNCAGSFGGRLFDLHGLVARRPAQTCVVSWMSAAFASSNVYTLQCTKNSSAVL